VHCPGETRLNGINFDVSQKHTGTLAIANRSRDLGGGLGFSSAVFHYASAVQISR